jgi:hypothetical protein
MSKIENIQGHSDFIPTSFADIISGLSTLTFFESQGISIPPPCTGGVETQIEWAIDEIREALSGTADEQKIRQKSSNAVVIARRGIACLADWILSAYGFNLCRDYSNLKAKGQSDILRQLGYYDEVTEYVLANGIMKRNELEHRYEFSELEEASDFVELVRHLFENLKANKWPGNGPTSFGSISGGTSWSAKCGYEGSFFGWEGAEPFLNIGTYDNPAWIGIVIPTNNENSEVLYCEINGLQTKELMQLYKTIHYNVNNRRGGSWSSREGLFAKMRAAGLVIDKTVA